jgi:hypothetical protein
MTDWADWSREAVWLMQSRNAEWQARFDLGNSAYRWDLESATIAFQRADDDVVASITLIGTTSVAERTFLWAWANDAIPPVATVGLDRVRAFGTQNDLSLLTQGEIQGGHPEALEVLALAGRILDAEGVFIDRSGDVGCFFALRDFRIERKT